MEKPLPQVVVLEQSTPLHFPKHIEMRNRRIALSQPPQLSVPFEERLLGQVEGSAPEALEATVNLIRNDPRIRMIAESAREGRIEYKSQMHDDGLTTGFTGIYIYDKEGFILARVGAKAGDIQVASSIPLWKIQWNSAHVERVNSKRSRDKVHSYGKQLNTSEPPRINVYGPGVRERKVEIFDGYHRYLTMLRSLRIFKPIPAWVTLMSDDQHEQLSTAWFIEDAPMQNSYTKIRKGSQERDQSVDMALRFQQALQMYYEREY